MLIGEKIQKARANGVADDELLDYFARKEPDYTDRIRLAQNSGYNASEILNSMAKSSKPQQVPENLTPIQEQLNKGLYSHKNAVEREEQGLAPTFMRGLRRSSAGRYLMEQEPEEERLNRERFAPEPTLAESAIQGLGTYVGDIPAMTVASAIAPGGPIVQGAAAFALPEAMKQIRDRYEEAKKTHKDLSWEDYLKIAYEGTVNPEVAKHAVLGGTLGAIAPALTAVARTPLLASFLKNPKVTERVVRWGTLAGEVGVLGADKAIEKGELPNAHDIADIGTQLLTLKLAHGSAKQLKKIFNLSPTEIHKAIEDAPKEVQADLLNQDINSSKFGEALAQVMESGRKKAESAAVVAKREAAELRDVGKQTLESEILSPKEQKIAERKLESKAKRIERKGERQATSIHEKFAKREAKAKETGYLVYKEGEINPTTETPDKRVKIRYTPLKPDEVGKPYSEVISKYVGNVKPETFLEKGAKFAKEAVTEPRKTAQKVWHKIYAGLFDKAKVLEVLGKKSGDKDLRAAFDRMKRVDAAVEYDINYGEADPITREKISDQSLRNMVGETLPEFYGEEGATREDLKNYLGAASSIDRTNLGQRNPIPTEAAEGIQVEKPFFKRVAKALDKFQDRYLKHAVKRGLLSPEGYKAMKEMYKAYIPLYRVQGDESIEPGPKGKGLAASNPFMAAKGSEKQITDPIDNIIKNVRSLVKSTAANDFANQLRRSLEAQGLKATSVNAPRIPGAAEAGNKQFVKNLEASGGWFAPDAFSDGKNTLYGYKNGKRWKMEGVPKEILDLFRAPAPAGKFLKAIQGLKQFFSKGITVYNPIGSTLIGLRDMMNTAVASRGPLGAATYYAEFLPAVASVLKKDARFQDFIKSGFYTHTYRGMNKTPFEESITDIFGAAQDKSNPELRSWAVDVIAAPGNMIKKLGRMMESYSEGWADAGRIAWLESEIKRPEYDGLSRSEAYKKATAVGNDRLLQFDRQGGWVLPQILSKTLPFYNTAMQDTATLARLVKSGGPAFYANAAISITLPAIATHLSVMNDDRYQRLPDYIKQRNYIVKPYFGLWDNGTDDLWMFPKQWSYGYLFGTSAEMFIDYLVDKEGEQSAWDSVMQWAQGLAEENNPVQVIWGGPRQLIPPKLQRVAASEQYTPNTTGFAKKVGEIFNVSPIYVDSAISYLGSPLAKNLLHLADELLFYADIKDDQRPEGRNFAALFLSRFYKSGADLRSSYLNKFYELAEKADVKVNTYNLHRKRGQEEEANKLEDSGLYRTQKARKLISAIYQEADEIQQAPLSEISAKEKERLLRELAQEMDELAKDFVRDMKESGV
jgi:hypothetical protein